MDGAKAQEEYIRKQDVADSAINTMVRQQSRIEELKLCMVRLLQYVNKLESMAHTEPRPVHEAVKNAQAALRKVND